MPVLTCFVHNFASYLTPCSFHIKIANAKDANQQLAKSNENIKQQIEFTAIMLADKSRLAERLLSILTELREQLGFTEEMDDYSALPDSLRQLRREHELLMEDKAILSENKQNLEHQLSEANSRLSKLAEAYRDLLGKHDDRKTELENLEQEYSMLQDECDSLLNEKEVLLKQLEFRQSGIITNGSSPLSTLSHTTIGSPLTTGTMSPTSFRTSSPGSKHYSTLSSMTDSPSRPLLDITNFKNGRTLQF